MMYPSNAKQTNIQKKANKPDTKLLDEQIFMFNNYECRND